MLVNDNIRKCVAFLAARRTEYEVRATVFFLMYPIENSNEHEIYAVTAAHAIENLSELSSDGRVFIRLNTSDGKSRFLETRKDDWEFHDDLRIDLAVRPMHWTDGEFMSHSHLCAFSEGVITKELVERLEVAPGEELFFPGLLPHHSGNESNVPILRTGTIAALPNEEIRTKLGSTTAYLAEVRSIGGHSGSPAFLHHSFEKRLYLQKRNPSLKPILAAPLLLGCVHGHIPYSEERPAAFLPIPTTIGTECSYGREDYNSGIAVVTPAWEILHVLNQSRLIEQRRMTGNRVGQIPRT